MREVYEAKTKRDYLLNVIDQHRTELSQYSVRSLAEEEAQLFAQATAKEVQDAVLFAITDIVNDMLNAVFPDMYNFVASFTIKRSGTECEMYIEDREAPGIPMDPDDANGGGLADVIELGLRIACLIMAKVDRVLVLDEPLLALDIEKKPLIAEMLRGLSEEAGIQMIITTHDIEFMAIADKCFSVSKHSGRSIVKEVT